MEYSIYSLKCWIWQIVQRSLKRWQILTCECYQFAADSALKILKINYFTQWMIQEQEARKMRIIHRGIMEKVHWRTWLIHGKGSLCGLFILSVTLSFLYLSQLFLCLSQEYSNHEYVQKIITQMSYTGVIGKYHQCNWAQYSLIWFEISVDDTVAMQIFDCKHSFSKIKSSHIRG